MRYTRFRYFAPGLGLSELERQLQAPSGLYVPSSGAVPGLSRGQVLLCVDGVPVSQLFQWRRAWNRAPMKRLTRFTVQGRAESYRPSHPLDSEPARGVCRP